MTKKLIGAALMIAVLASSAEAQRGGRGGPGGGGPGGGPGGASGGRSGASPGRSPGAGGGGPGSFGGAGGGAGRQSAPGGQGGFGGLGGGANSGTGKAPGGSWSDGSRNGGGQFGAFGAAGLNRSNPGDRDGNPDADAAAVNRNRNNPSGKEDAAAGAAVSNRNQPQATGKEDAAAGAAAANRNQPNFSGAEGAAAGAAHANENQAQTDRAAAGYAAVRDSYDHPNAYSDAWHADHPDAWAPAAYASGNAWAAADYTAVANHVGYVNANPAVYNYGANVAYQDGNVVVNGQNAGTAAAYSQQASDLAANGYNAAANENDEWLPIGVYGLVRDENQHPQSTLQLAINKQGVLRGNYHDTLADSTLPVHGSVDKETQRAAWTVGENSNFIMEAGLKNLTSGEASTLIHKNGETVRWWLIRLQQPGDSNAAQQ
ncbi:hypothetical protein SH661x_001484 [Planctomicrobium sp. SH661]|uniref:hypothetical protein n=1 Tax=Planctomicrobium sp. SH661 TaxID=3448124 RepID=UPI003F5BE716